MVILDLMLPKLSGEEFVSGYEIMNEMKFLSSCYQTEDKITGLKIGADDYSTKPCDQEELIAHVEAVLGAYLQ